MYHARALSAGIPLVFVGFALGAELRGPSDVEKLAMAARRGIERGELHLRLEVWGGQVGRYKRVDERISVFFDGQKLRLDRSRTARDAAARDAPAAVVDKFVRTAEQFIFWSETSYPPWQDLAVDIGSPQTIPEVFQHAIFDPRAIGMNSQGPHMLHVARLDEVLGCADRTESEIIQENEDLFRVHYSRPNGVRLRCWISPKQGYSVVRIELEAEYPGEKLVDTTESEIALYGPQPTWFPKVVHYRRLVSQKVIQEARLQVEKAQFGQEIDPAQFTLKGLNIPKGTYVYNRLQPAKRRTGVWDGSTVVYQERGVRRLENPPARPWRYPLAAGTAILASIALFLGWRRRRRRPRLGADQSRHAQPGVGEH